MVATIYFIIALPYVVLALHHLQHPHGTWPERAGANDLLTTRQHPSMIFSRPVATNC